MSYELWELFLYFRPKEINQLETHLQKQNHCVWYAQAVNGLTIKTSKNKEGGNRNRHQNKLLK